MDLSTPEKIRDSLHTALGNIGLLEQCALLDYPNHLNIGDHLIWLGELFYLTDVLKTKIKYVANIQNFSPEEMEKQIGKSPILLHGGGNLGDLWPAYQKAREEIISTYRDRPIIILPQSIYFAHRDNLNKAADVFNSHPNLTLFARENYSYELAIKHFHQCRIIKAPDSAFQMIDLPLPSFKLNSKRQILYLCREDSELNESFSPTALNLLNLVVKDWINEKWIYRWMVKDSPDWYWRIPGIVLLVREGWQRGLSNPSEWLSRQQWERFHPGALKINAITPVGSFNRLYNCPINKFSWSLMHSGIYLLKQSRLVITNRLHGHILCILLGIPHILLPNSYYKNESFYETWTYQIPFCKFIKEPSQIKPAIKELLDSFEKQYV